MTTATELPAWVLYAVSVGTPASALAGVLITWSVTRRGAGELELRSRREEVLRTLRWAAELAVAGDPRTARLGVAQLVALAASDLLDQPQQRFVDAALEVATRTDVREIVRTAADEGVTGDARDRMGDGRSDLSSERGRLTEEGRA